MLRVFHITIKGTPRQRYHTILVINLKTSKITISTRLTIHNIHIINKSSTHVVLLLYDDILYLYFKFYILIYCINQELQKRSLSFKALSIVHYSPINEHPEDGFMKAETF